MNASNFGDLYKKINLQISVPAIKEPQIEIYLSSFPSRLKKMIGFVKILVSSLICLLHHPLQQVRCAIHLLIST